MLIKGPVTTPYTIVPHSVRLTFLQAKNDEFLTVLISHTSDVLILLVFPRDYICTFLSYGNLTNCSFHLALITETHEVQALS